MLAGLLRSRLRAKVLGWLLSHPRERCFGRQLAALLAEDSTNISRELARLAALGILVSRTEGRQKYYQADMQCPVFPELRGLVMKTVGLADILRAALVPMKADITAAFVYGSQAGGTGSAGSDVDLFVVGDVDEMAVHRALTEAEHQLARPVNYKLLSRREYRALRKKRDGFVARVLVGAKIFIIGTADEL